MSEFAETSSADVIVNVFGRTDVGRTREHNEDSFVVADLSTDNATLQPEVRKHVVGPKGTLFMVADGMGGAAAGEIASAMAIDAVLTELRRSWMAKDSSDPEDFVRSLKGAIKSANEKINAYAAAHPEFRGMGTTATTAAVLGNTLYLAQIGDSRGYLIRDGVARQITKDQSLMQKLIEAGELTEEEAEHSERRNIILQALGPETAVKVDLTYQEVRKGDTLLVCCDGLSGPVHRDLMGKIVGREPDLMKACKQLIDAANEAGGPDNITVILARFEGPGLRDAEDEDEVGHRPFPLMDAGATPPTGIDRVVSSGAPAPPPTASSEGPTARFAPDPEAGRATLATEEPAEAAVDEEEETDDDVSSARRSTGRLIAVALFLLLVTVGGWMLLRVAKKNAVSTGNATPSTAPTKP